MADIIDANSLGDPQRIRRAILAEMHDACMRHGGQYISQDGNTVTLDKVLADIQAEYADDPTEPAPAPVPVPPGSRK
jgi:hypothetical protein